MGLRHNAIHAMLANPHLAPFDLIDKPPQRQDWTLIDHLMVIHKVKESDYTQDDPQASIVNMARTLAHFYISEDEGSRYVVLVKDGARAQKPAVRELRLNRTPAPHLAFCARNLCAIEYTMMKLLADMGMKNKLFLVTGAKGECEVPSVENLVSYHTKYLDHFEHRDDDPKHLERELCQLDPGYADGKLVRPDGLQGVFVATFADPETPQVSLLRAACLVCRSTEADTLLVELANALVGNVTVCSGDSDVVAVLTARGRAGITMRMDNKSYRVGRLMHTSTFGGLLCAIPDVQALRESLRELLSSEGRFRVLCDVNAGDERLLPETREQHKNFEAILDKYGKADGRADLKLDVAGYLYQAGIRGSLYVAFLSNFSSRGACLKVLSRAVDGPVSANTVSFIFETLWPVPDQPGLTSSAESEDTKCTGEKRKISCLQGCDEVPELELDDRGNATKSPSEERERVLAGLKRLSKAYMNGRVPRGSHGRFLRLSGAGWYFYMRIKSDVLKDEKNRTAKLLFMALCGTDYNAVPGKLGIKTLMTAAVLKYKEFSSWCQSLRRLWDAIGSCTSRDCYIMGEQLSRLANVPGSYRSKYWTEFNCKLMVRSMKYVYELWNLMRPRPGPEYGFSERDGVVSFDREDSTPASTLDSRLMEV